MIFPPVLEAMVLKYESICPGLRDGVRALLVEEGRDYLWESEVIALLNRPGRKCCKCRPITRDARDWFTHVSTVAPMDRDEVVGYDPTECPVHFRTLNPIASAIDEGTQ